jgi:rhamnosyl/mannosyltransferase
LKVLHFYKTYDISEEYGGVQRFINQLVEGGLSHGVKADILALSSNKSELIELDGYKIHKIKRLFKFASTDISLRVFGVFKRLANNADIIHYHFPYPLADIAHLISKHNKPSLVSYHSDIIAQKNLFKIYKPLMNRFFNSISAIVYASPNYFITSPILKNFSDKAFCIPYGLSNSYNLNPLLLKYWKTRLPDRFFLFVGTLRYYKGLDFLLTAAKNIPCPIVLVGQGPLESHLRSRITSEKLTNIHFLGSLGDQDKYILLNLCYGFIFPSHLRSEAFGISLLEAARQGRPLICCDIGTGTTFINLHEVTGIVVPPEDPIALQNAMLKLWNDSDLAHKLGFRAQQRFNNIFTVDKMVDSYLKLYKSFLK